MKFEYKVIPAPKKGKRGKGIRNSEDKFAHAFAEVMNEHGADGWQYLRTDTLPVEARTGLAGKATIFQNMMVFQRALDADAPAEIDTLEPNEAEEVMQNHAPALLSPVEDLPSLPNKAKDVPSPEITGAKKHD